MCALTGKRWRHAAWVKRGILVLTYPKGSPQLLSLLLAQGLGLDLEQRHDAPMDGVSQRRGKTLSCLHGGQRSLAALPPTTSSITRGNFT
jgi:hypothetical protein